MKQFPTLAKKLPRCLAEKSSSLFWFDKNPTFWGLGEANSSIVILEPGFPWRAMAGGDGKRWGETKASYPIKREDFRKFLQNGEEEIQPNFCIKTLLLFEAFQASLRRSVVVCLPKKASGYTISYGGG